jgi:ABC-type transport system involved in multi-copper enzyme maturation permease subunit
LERCLTRTGADCSALINNLDRYDSLQWFLPLVIAAPAFFGMFWGAPLVARELENGTHRLVWTQGVTRRRWITSKLAIVLGGTVLASGILALTVTWWSRPFVDAGKWVRFQPGNFDLQGIVPIAYTVFAVALGSLFRKTLPAAFATLAGFAAVRIPIGFLRRYYMAPETSLTPFKVDEPILSSTGQNWVLSSQIVDGSGASTDMFLLSPQTLAERCPDLLGPDQLLDKANAGRCIQRIGLQMSETFHPAGRFWAFQWIEAGIFLALAAALIAFVIWRVKRVS